MNYIEVKDEILNGEQRFRIRDENGNIILDNLTIEMITPLLQQATPLNKLLFDKITSRLALSSKYNNPSFTIEESTMKMHIDAPLEKYENGQKVDLYIVPEFEEFNGDVFPTDFTSNTQRGFIASTTSKIDASAYQAFNGEGCAWGYSGTPANCQNSMEVSIKCPVAIIPSTFYVKLRLPADNSRSGTFTIYGSKNGETWDTLISQSISVKDNDDIREYTLSCTTQEDYKYFKIYVYSNTADDYTNQLYFFNIKSGKKSTFNQNYPQTLQIGSLSEVPIEGTIELIKKTSLIYLNDKFIVNETEGVV